MFYRFCLWLLPALLDDGLIVNRYPSTMEQAGAGKC
jgi:hypothetical protein